MRIGMNSGPVVAGVVGGSTMPRYHLFGKTVEVAEAMEQHGAVGQIRVSSASLVAIARERGMSEPPNVDVDEMADRASSFLQMRHGFPFSVGVKEVEGEKCSFLLAPLP